MGDRHDGEGDRTTCATTWRDHAASWAGDVDRGGGRWVGTTKAGARIAAEAPADDDHPLVAQAEEYRELADAAETVYVVVVYDNTEGTETIDVFDGGRAVTQEGEDVRLPHFASAGGVFEGQIDDYLPRTVQEEAHAWYADFYEHQAVAPGAVEEVELEPDS